MLMIGIRINEIIVHDGLTMGTEQPRRDVEPHQQSSPGLLLGRPLTARPERCPEFTDSAQAQAYEVASRAKFITWQRCPGIVFWILFYVYVVTARDACNYLAE